MACFLKHDWAGCKCAKCEKTRDKEHQFSELSGQCKKKCSICGKIEDTDHPWEGCKCTKCGKTRDTDEHAWEGCRCVKCEKTRDEQHAWAYTVDKKQKTCARCGATKPVDADEQSQLGFIEEMEKTYGLACDYGSAVQIVGQVKSDIGSLAKIASPKYNFPFEKLWAGDISSDEIERHEREYAESFDDILISVIQRVVVPYILAGLSLARPQIESSPDVTYMALIKECMPEEEREALYAEAASLTTEEKIARGKAFYQKAYEAYIAENHRGVYTGNWVFQGAVIHPRHGRMGTTR